MSELKPKKYTSKERLEQAISLSMPDEYPEGMAKVFADKMLAEGTAIIVESAEHQKNE